MEKTVTIQNKTGLHARPASVFVREAGKYQSDIKLEREGRQVNAKSIMGILALGLNQGSEVKIIAVGADEKEAIEELTGLIDGKFGEE